ncbi:MAG TPA: hypothetical protein DCS88_02800 [Alphaproteobacteria bacterium]|nr:hypothetical protein [Alphaproteobacteria bacterium]
MSNISNTTERPQTVINAHVAIRKTAGTRVFAFLLATIFRPWRTWFLAKRSGKTPLIVSHPWRVWRWFS